MTLAQKVGQLLVPTVPGLTAEDGGAELIRRYHLGGVIYFGQNVRDAAQVAALSAGLQQAARSQPPHLPLLIGTDQEGGIVSRLAGVTTVFPGQMAAGATRDPALIRAQDQATGAAMRALGVNLDYAPVADVNVDPANPVIGIRSFGADPALVATMTAAAVDGFRQAGEVTVAKHFPGHGDTGTDSHTGLPVIHHTLRQWWAIDAPPFQAAIRAGVDEIMIGHIEVPALDDSGQPASLSHQVVTGLLRDRGGVGWGVRRIGRQAAGHARHIPDLTPTDVAAPKPTRLKDYGPPAFLVDTVELTFQLGEAETIVKSRLAVRRNPAADDPGRTAGPRRRRAGAGCGGARRRAARRQPLSGDVRRALGVIAGVPDAFTLDVETRIDPQGDTELSGLYRSGGDFCTQCEPGGVSPHHLFCRSAGCDGALHGDGRRRQERVPGIAVERQPRWRR